MKDMEILRTRLSEMNLVHEEAGDERKVQLSFKMNDRSPNKIQSNVTINKK
jgi:hypothetical protein